MKANLLSKNQHQHNSSPVRKAHFSPFGLQFRKKNNGRTAWIRSAHVNRALSRQVQRFGDVEQAPVHIFHKHRPRGFLHPQAQGF